MTPRPDPSEYAPYYGKYIELVEGADIVATLERQMSGMLALLAGVPEGRSLFRYEPGKWNVREVVGHINDTERIFAYRMLRIARGDATPIEGFDQDAYAAASPSGGVPLADLAREFAAIRGATVALLRHLDETAWARRGTANRNEVSVRALAWIAAGHELHHRKALREKYLEG
jgi:hypothetical protein